MSALPKIVAIGALDARGIANTSGLRATWQELETEAPGTGRAFRTLFGKSDATFRRLDQQTRALVMAASACGFETLLSSALREETALIVETSRGSLEADLRYTRALAQGQVQGSIFPYTLQSTCLGDVALRLGLRGPTLSLSIAPEDEGLALHEARRFFDSGEVRFAAVGLTDALDEELATSGPVLRAVVALVVAAGEHFAPVAPWPEGLARPFDLLADACHSTRAGSDR